MTMYTLGHDFMPPGIHAGGLRYHGDSPLISQLYHDKLIEARAYNQVPVFEAALQFANTESIIPAPRAPMRYGPPSTRRCWRKRRGRRRPSSST